MFSVSSAAVTERPKLVAQTTDSYFSQFWTREGRDRGARVVGFWGELPSWLAHGWLLAMFSHGGERERESTRERERERSGECSALSGVSLLQRALIPP